MINLLFLAFESKVRHAIVNNLLRQAIPDAHPLEDLPRFIIPLGGHQKAGALRHIQKKCHAKQREYDIGYL